ncbi:MAG TPA: recombinase family protein [Rhizomicrobium sp.]|nr:recombinase family protein [Rhizomicrobium sp.]
MKGAEGKILRCAIYTRVSTDAGLEQDFNSLDAQREASEAYIKSQAHEGWRLIRTGYDDGGFSGGSLDRPSLQRLLGDIKARLIDVVLVYKVDRLTRSLADFAKLVELFDAHGVSFVSVTQAFNTTSSMGRLTLNVLLSFAQFEREVTGERIRDKVAASKKKGIWMGGNVPLGYRVEDRKLLVNPDEAATVRMLFERYLKLGSIPALLTELNDKGVRTRVRQTAKGRTGGVPFTAGPLSYLLNNRIFLGEIVHKGQVYPGEHEAILDRSLFEAVQAKLAENRHAHRRAAEASDALLAGRIFDDRGNTMTPTYSRKGRQRYRYYVSRAFTQGRKVQVGTVHRVPAPDVEAEVINAVRTAGVEPNTDLDDRALLKSIQRATVERGQIKIELSLENGTSSLLRVPWSPKPGKIKRTITLPHADPTKDQRPIRVERRDALLRAVAQGRLWLKELISGTVKDTAAIAAREDRSQRSVQMMISLAFVAPDIIEAAVSGTLPRGIGLTRLMNLPPLWTQQRRQLGLRS